MKGLLKTNMIIDGVHRGDPNVRIAAKHAREQLAERLSRGTVRTPRLPAALPVSTALLRQRVEVKTRFRERTGVVTKVKRGAWIAIADPVAYDPRGFWTHGEVFEVFLVEQIERLTVLEGPAKAPEKLELPKRRRRPAAYSLDFIARAAQTRRANGTL